MRRHPSSSAQSWPFGLVAIAAAGVLAVLSLSTQAHRPVSSADLDDGGEQMERVDTHDTAAPADVTADARVEVQRAPTVSRVRLAALLWSAELVRANVERLAPRFHAVPAWAHRGRLADQPPLVSSPPQGPPARG